MTTTTSLLADENIGLSPMERTNLTDALFTSIFIVYSNICRDKIKLHSRNNM